MSIVHGPAAVAAVRRMRAKYTLPALAAAGDFLCWLRMDMGFDNTLGARIRDQSGNYSNFSMGLPTQAPAYERDVANGHPAYTFDGSNDALLNGIFGGGENLADPLCGGSDKAFSLFFAIDVISVPTDPSNADLFVAINSGNQTNGLFRFGYTDANWYLFKRGSGVSTGDQFGGSGLTTGLHFVSLVHSGTSVTVRLDGADDYTVAQDVDAMTGLDSATLCRFSGGGNACNVKLLEFIAADGALSGGEVDEIEDYFDDRYVP